MFETVLFDLDGTLTDPALGITNSVAYALSKWNISVKDRSELFKFIGPPLLDSFSEYYGFSDEQSRLALKYYREYFTDRGMFENRVYNGIPGIRGVQSLCCGSNFEHNLFGNLVFYRADTVQGACRLE